ncbi:serine hydrolase domain-containing protein [Microbacterium sediminicola]|uniref:Serine hydrolase domain-containing protein n=1 Tax=Microbacterium sediminicola TaxID=415210 RepID=A0ABP4UCP8_9MICO
MARAVRRARHVVGATVGILTATLALSACAGADAVEIDLPAQVEAAFPADTQTQLEAAVTEAMAATGSSGAIVGVWAPWSGEWIAGVGTQTATGSEPVDADMEFRAARITRAMTCDVLYALADEGVVSLDDVVSESAPGAAGLTDMTLGQLCDSTSGLGTYADVLWPKWVATPDRIWAPLELAAFGVGEERDTVPGSGFVNSDAGYILLGTALEAATNRPLSDLIASYVTEPLGLESTWLPGDEPATPAGDSEALSLVGGQSLRGEDGQLQCTEPRDLTEASASMGWADSGVVSTISDLGRYVQALATGALLGEGQTRFANPFPVSSSSPSWYTYTGGAFQAGSLIGQHGALPGYMTAAYADPETGLTVAVVLNNTAASSLVVRDLAWELAAIASKAPAASGETAPAAGLPWTAEQQQEAVLQRAVCPLPAP